MTLKERLERPDWPRIAFACKRNADGFCQNCGDEFPYPYIGLEAHHNTYKRLGRERPTDLTALCRPCHAAVTWAKKYGPRNEKESLHIIHAIDEVLAKTGIVRLADVEERYQRHARDLESRLCDIAEEADLLLLMSEVGRQGHDGERRAA